MFGDEFIDSEIVAPEPFIVKPLIIYSFKRLVAHIPNSGKLSAGVGSFEKYRERGFDRVWQKLLYQPPKQFGPQRFLILT